MPSPGVYKIYVENGYYHIFNRGNNKQTIFRDDVDYKVFFKLFWDLIRQPYPHQPHQPPDVIPLCYCLMPNHFHLLLKQTSNSGITNLMTRLIVRYVLFFNKKHQRTGHLFQSVFKAKLVDEEPYLLHVSRYIHLNPQSIWRKPLHTYPYSSYSHYLNPGQNHLLSTQDILSFFTSAQRLSLRDYLSYESFVEDFKHPEDIALTYQFLS